MMRRTEHRVPRGAAQWLPRLSVTPTIPDSPSGGASGGGAFDDLLALAALACATPFAVLHLVDEPAGCFAAGTDAQFLPAPLKWPGIPEALGSGAITTSADAPADPMFARHASVKGAPHIRSLVTVPLSNELGEPIGAIGVFDTTERTDPIPVDAVLRVARSVLRQVQLRRETSGSGTQVPSHPTAEAAGLERRRVLDGIMVHTDALIYAKDIQGRFLFVNRALTDSFAFPSDMVGRTDHAMFPAEQADSFRNNDQRIIRSGEAHVFEEVLTHADGSVHTYRSTKFPVRDRTGQIYAVAGVSVDVSELAAARQAHQEAEQRWHTLVDQASIGVAVLGRGGVFRYVNRQAAAMLGAWSRNSLIGRTVGEFLPRGADAASFAPTLAAIVDGAPPVRSQRARLRTGDGDQITVEFSAASIVDRGEPAVQVEIRDVTAAAIAEEKLVASVRRFRAVFDNSPVAMGITNETGRWVDTNAALDRMLGAEPGELLGAAGRDFAHPDDRALIDAARAAQPTTDGAPPGMEIRFVRRDGEQRWAWVSLTAVPGLGGEKWGLGISKDVTDRKLAEIALRESQQDLAAVAAVAKCVQSGKDPRPVVVESIRELSAASSVVLTEALDQDTLVVTAGAGKDIVGLQMSLHDVSMTAQVWRSGQRVFVADVAENSTVSPTLLKANAAASALWQPVVVRGQVQAVVGVGWEHRIEDPGDRAIRVVQVIADEAGTSLQASRLHSEMERMATTDPLTGSLNRRAWDRALQRLMELAQIKGEPLAIAILDLDHFKAYNDRHGHMAGDLRLTEFAVAARSCLRKEDVFARWGGEEFVVALPGCSPEQAARILHRILKRIRAAAPAGFTCSMGSSTWIPGEELASCIGRADAALYAAKNSGRNQIVAA